MAGSVRRIVMPAATVVLVGAGLALPVALAAGPPTVTVQVATGHKPAGGDSYVRYPSDATIRGRITTRVWTVHHVAGNDDLEGLSCPSAHLCVATDSTGDVLSSTNPSGGASAWVSHHVDQGADIHAVSCPSVELCVAVDNAGNVVTSTNPADPQATWTTTNVDGSATLVGISCPSIALCVAVDDQGGNAILSTNPTGGSGAWTTLNLTAGPTGIRLEAVSCPTTSLCVIVTQSNAVITSTNPTGGPSQWGYTYLSDITQTQDLTAPNVVCPTISLCVVGGGALTYVSRAPAGGPVAWHRVRVPDAAGGISACAGTALCLETDHFGNVAASMHPAGGSGSWSRRHYSLPPNGDGFATMTCLSTTRCVGVDSGGDVLYSTNPSGRFTVELKQQPFPFNAKPTVDATAQTGTGTYSFTVHPEVATRYTVSKLGPGPVRHSKASTIYVIPSFHLGRESLCRTRPTCRVTAGFTYRIPKQVQASETAKPWHLYTRVSQHSRRVRGVWHRDSTPTIHELKIGTDRYRVKLAFTIDDGNGRGGFEIGWCRKQTEARNGFDFPGHDLCGRSTLPAKYFG
jgi:hypothetical protein